MELKVKNEMCSLPQPTGPETYAKIYFVFVSIVFRVKSKSNQQQNFIVNHCQHQIPLRFLFFFPLKEKIK